MEDEAEKTDRSFTILKGFETYCIELISKGSASDICSSYDELILRADGLEKDHRAFIGRPRELVEVTFKATDLREVIQKFNKLTMLSESSTVTFSKQTFYFIMFLR